MTSNAPTPEGMKRYPHTDGYNLELVDPIACTCGDACAPRCAGECECDACSVQFSTFCNVAGFHDAAPASEEEARALSAYRGGGVAR